MNVHRGFDAWAKQDWAEGLRKTGNEGIIVRVFGIRRFFYNAKYSGTVPLDNSCQDRFFKNYIYSFIRETSYRCR